MGKIFGLILSLGLIIASSFQSNFGTDISTFENHQAKATGFGM